MHILLTVILMAMLWFPGGGTIAAAQPDSPCPVPSELTVRGRAVLQVPADRMQMRIGVVVSAETAEKALQMNAQKMTLLRKALEAGGLSQSEYQTGQFQIQPNWSKRPLKSSGDGHPEIVGYTVTNVLQLKTAKIDLAGRLIESAASAGGNRIDAITFGLADPRSYRARAIAAATENAAADARSLAEAAGARLGRIVNLRLDDAVAAPRRFAQVRMMEAGGSAAGPEVDIIPGDVAVEAGVTVVYQLAP